MSLSSDCCGGVYFLFDYLAVMGLFVPDGYCLSKLLKKIPKV